MRASANLAILVERHDDNGITNRCIQQFYHG
jgi:hypothetical protein